MERVFTLDMFSNHEPNWRILLAPLVGKPNVDYLEVGSYEGRSLCWMLDNVLTDLTCRAVAIDTWGVQPDWKEHGADEWDAVFARFRDNVGGDPRVWTLAGDSAEQLARLMVEGRRFDVVYIDGSHRALDCLTDMAMAWRLLKPGGLLIVDDVGQWRGQDWPTGDHPTTACKMFSEVSYRDMAVGNGQAVFQKGRDV